MKISQAGIDFIKSKEQLRLIAYRDIVGKLTIGYGHTGPDVMPGLVIHADHANYLLLEDLAVHEDEVNLYVSVDLTQDEFDALVSLCYNIGNGAFHGSTMRKLLNSGDYAGAAKEFEKWDKAGGKVVAGLLNRRVEEETMFNQPDTIA